MANPQGVFNRILSFIWWMFIFSGVPYIPVLIYPKAHMGIHSSYFDDFTLIQTYILPIIFDTGASMSISPYKIYFVGPITPLPEPITLGGMARCTPIDRIRISQCIFHIGSTTPTIHTHYYHIPNSHACLLIPQRLFSACGVSTGTFTIGDKCDMLFLGGKPYLHD